MFDSDYLQTIKWVARLAVYFEWLFFVYLKPLSLTHLPHCKIAGNLTKATSPPSKQSY